MTDITETNTPYAKIIPGSSTTLDVIWSESGHKPGSFFAEHHGAGINTKILMNMKSIDLYQNGVPGISDEVEGVAEWLKEKIAYFEPKHVRSYGHSAGGSAAIGFGHAIKADTVIAVGPELELGIPAYRSFDRSVDKRFHPKYRNLGRYVHLLGNRLTLVYSGYDTSDFRHIFNAMKTASNEVFYVREMHSGEHAVNWKRVARQPGPVRNKLLIDEKKLEFKFDSEAVWRGVMSYEAIGKADGFAAELLEGLMEIDPNPGIKYRLSVQKAILGDVRAADRLGQEAGMALKTISLDRLLKEYRLKLAPPVFRAVKELFTSLAEEHSHLSPEKPFMKQVVPATKQTASAA